MMKYMRVTILVTVSLLLSYSVRADLVAYYGFDGDDASDGSGFGNAGAVGNTVTFATDLPFGTAGKAAQFDGSNGAAGIVTVPNTPSLEGITHELTLSTWIRADSTANPNWFRFMRKGVGANPGTTWMWNRFNNSQDTNLRVDTNDGTSGQFNQNRGNDTDVVLDNNWHQLVFTLNNGQWAEYIDGQASGSGTYIHGNGFSNTHAIQIGGRAGGDNMVGLMDDIGIWDTALTVGEARAIHQFASESALAYGLDTVHLLHELPFGQTVDINSETWQAVDNLTGAEGVLENNAGRYAINFGGGMGVVTIPEPGSFTLVLMGTCLLIFANRRRV